MNNFLQDLKITTKDLLRRKGRSFLTILGIIIGVAGVIIIMSLGAGAQSLVLGQVTKLGSNLVGILPGKSDNSGPPAAVFGIQIKTLKEKDLDTIRKNVPNILGASAFVSGSVTIISGRESVDTSFTATDGDYTKIQNVEMEKGVFFSEEEANSGANVIVLGSLVAESLFPEGEEIGKVVKIKIPNVNNEKNANTGTVPFRVIGVQKRLGSVGFQNQDDQVFIPFTIGQRQILGIDYVQFIYAKVNSEENVNQAMQDIEMVLREEHNIKRSEDDDFSVRNIADAIKLLTGITDTLRIFLALMASISLLVGGIGIMNIMLVNISERTREIGLRKALGATRKQIRNQFLFEAMTLTSSGGIIGILLGTIVSYLIALGVRFAGYDWDFVISFVAIFLAVSVSVLVGVVFGLYPAMKASNKDPIESLRYE